MQPLERNEINASTRQSKIAMYGWEMKDAPGRLEWIPKGELTVDHSYQREASLRRVLSIASRWSWLACGVIIVAHRHERHLQFVVDGQHRVMAALKRSDIDLLPCLVFETEGPEEEAGGFVDANTNRRLPTSKEKWKAQVLRGDPDTMLVDTLVRQSGRVVAKYSSPTTVACLTAMLRAVRTDRERLTRLWPLIVDVCQGHAMPDRIFEGLIWIDSRLPDGQSLMDKRWRDRVMRVGYEELLQAAQRASTFYARGGSRVFGLGMLEAINKGCRIKMTVQERGGQQGDKS